MPRRRNDPENTQGGGEAKEPRINRGEQHSKTASPSSSYHGDDSPQVIQPTISTWEEDFKDQPPVWAKDRTDLCNTINWFRSYQGSSYTINKTCYGFLLDGHGGPRDYIDDEIVITRTKHANLLRSGGGCVVENGSVIQDKDLSEATSAVISLRASKDSRLAVGLIIGDKNDAIWRKLPHKYNVMGWFRVVNVWFEKTDNGKFGARVRFQKLGLENPSWWAKKGSEDPLSLSQRMLIGAQSEICRTCGKSSMLTYEQGWMCLQRNCEACWKLKNGTSPTNLIYDTTFLSSREPPDDNIQPHFSLIPDLLTDMANPDAPTRRDAWRGVVCPVCKKCISRKHWNGWICSDPLDNNTGHQATCQWQMTMDMSAISIQSVLEIGATKRRSRTDREALIQPSIQTTSSYKIVTYAIDDVGRIVHFSARDSTLQKPNGPNELFERLQEVDLGMCRFPIVGLAIIRITKHRLGSKGGPTALRGEPAYKHKYSI
ncbi:hypothetical protein TMatcc_002667 [Talaromyces marneffei ATCC 18224]